MSEHLTTDIIISKMPTICCVSLFVIKRRTSGIDPLLPSPLQFFFYARPILERPEKEFASRPLETLATQATSREEDAEEAMLLCFPDDENT